MGMLWTLAADLSSIDRVCDELATWLNEHNYSAHLFSIQLLAREALNNAVIHGCHQDPSKQVTFELIPQENALILEVIDAGPGFDWLPSLQNDPPSENDIHGRGLWIYQFYAEKIEFNPCGNQVRLTYQLNQRKG